MNKSPTEAIIAVTLNCNARCVMCNIWQNNIKNEISPDFYHKLPSTLRDVNVTGGEPFLRSDLPDIIRVIKRRCPNARILINTNGYLFTQIEKLMKKITVIDPHIALRVSLDGFAHTHDNIRKLPNFFQNALKSLQICRQLGVKDLGVSYTLMEQNKHDLLKMYAYCSKNNYEFSLTVASDSPIYFGTGKISLRPTIDDELSTIFQQLENMQYRSGNPKEWFRSWFDKRLYEYIKTNTRALTCSAGDDFFYLDSIGRIYSCHLKPWEMGNLNKESFETIYNSPKASLFRTKARHCNDCWMVCSARAAIKNKLYKVIKEIVQEKIQAHMSEV